MLPRAANGEEVIAGLVGGLCDAEYLRTGRCRRIFAGQRHWQMIVRRLKRLRVIIVVLAAHQKRIDHLVKAVWNMSPICKEFESLNSYRAESIMTCRANHIRCPPIASSNVQPALLPQASMFEQSCQLYLVPSATYVRLG